MYVERDGDRHWLVINNRTPEQLWPQHQEFWKENGFILAISEPTIGIISTDWTENRTKITDDWFRRTVGYMINFAYSAGIRDRFCMLVSSAPSSVTDISITHNSMEEILTGAERISSRWEEHPHNPALETLFLAKLIQNLVYYPILSRSNCSRRHASLRYQPNLMRMLVL